VTLMAEALRQGIERVHRLPSTNSSANWAEGTVFRVPARHRPRHCSMADCFWDVTRVELWRWWVTADCTRAHRAISAEQVGVQQHRRVAVQLALHVQHVLRLQPAVVAEEPQVAPPAVTAPNTNSRRTSPHNRAESHDVGLALPEMRQ